MKIELCSTLLALAEKSDLRVCQCAVKTSNDQATSCDLCMVLKNMVHFTVAGKGCSSGIEYSLSMQKVLASIPGISLESCCQSVNAILNWMDISGSFPMFLLALNHGASEDKTFSKKRQ